MSKPATFEVGDKVRMTGEFLRNTGQYTGRAGTSRWTVKGLVNHPGCTPMVIVDEEADTAYFTAEELAAQPDLKWRRIAAANLEKCR